MFTFDVITVNHQGQQISKVTKQAQYFRENLGNGGFLDMVAIPGGKFWMGSPDTEPERWDNEGPQHPAIVPSFHIGKYPITQAQYEAVMGKNPSYFKGADLPVERVRWGNAVKFCEILAAKTGKAYRLPSEAEWEYACRAGTTTPFHFGDSNTTDLANYDGRYMDGNKLTGPYGQKTTPVGSFPPNAFGLYDMHGQVWEWCQDRWHGNYHHAPTDGSAWETGGVPGVRVRRGGAWFFDAAGCRCAYRLGIFLGVRGYGFGFRVALRYTNN